MGPAAAIGSNTPGEGLAFGRFNLGATTDVYVLASRIRQRGSQADKILLNRGSRSFEALTIGGTLGSGDDVAALDHNQDGRADFVVTNGNKTIAGPVQLFTWR